MVFTNLGSSEKDAFFSLLDEYFAARPELFGNDNPAEPSSPAAPTAPTPSAIAAAQRALAANLRTASPSNNAPPPAPRRGTSDSPAAPSPAAGLKSNRKIGSDVDVSSAKNMFSSLRQAGKTAPSTPSVPPAFAPPKNTWGAPPSRTRAAAPSPPPAQEEPEEEDAEDEEEERQGEWAEALYDYDSTDPGDLQIRAQQNVWVTERTSDDWWTGEFKGKTGLFPASYVKVL